MAGLVPPIGTPLIDPRTGNTNVQWWRFWSTGRAGAAGAAGEPGAAGAPGSFGPLVIVPGLGNVFTPNLGAGPLQYVLLTADSTLKQPTSEPAGTWWNLIIDQDAVGGHNLVFDPTYFFSANILGRALPSTRAQSQWLSDTSGNNSLSGLPSTDQPIPA
jgi:hypothetical protein